MQGHQDLLQSWHSAALTSVGLFWMALWAFVLGYLISGMIQVFVSRERMRKSMGDASTKSILLGTFFGFISSSCSFAALATTRSLFSKGAGLVSSLAFLLASTNLVIELGIVIGVFLGWQFVVGEYLGGILLILLMWLLVSLTLPGKLAERARNHAREQEGDSSDDEISDWKRLIRSTEGWLRVGDKFVMEWRMVWKDVTIGFTVAGIIAVFVPRSFFQSLFIGSELTDPSFWQLVLQSLVGPLAAFFTFIGSMGNIPLAAVLYNNGVSFAGIMAFIFSDLVVLPVLRIQARYYGWKMSFYILAIFLIILVTSSLLLHYGFMAFGALPDASTAAALSERDFFSFDSTFALNLFALGICAIFLIAKWRSSGFKTHGSSKISERITLWLSVAAFCWLGIGLLLPVVA